MNTRTFQTFLFASALLALLAAPTPAEQNSGQGRFLLVWAGDADRHDEDFVAIIDVRAGSPTFGHVLRTVPVGSKANEPHHIDFALRDDRRVWASGVLSGRTFIFDVSRAPVVKLVKVDEPGPERVNTPPHTYAWLPNGHTLATAMEMMPPHAGGTEGAASGLDPAPGGLLEFDQDGSFLRHISAQDPKAGNTPISPYGMAVKPDIDRIVTTNASHGWLPSMKHFTPGFTVQVWRMSDLKLLHTLRFPAGPRGNENVAPYEPRFAHAAGSQTVFVNCVEGDALYLSTNIASAQPSFQLVYDFGHGAEPAYPVLTRDDRFYLQPLTSANKVVVLDVSNPSHPKQVSEVPFDHDPTNPAEKRLGQPHYLVPDFDESRLAVSDYILDIPAVLEDGDRRVYLLKFDPKSGALGFDNTFRDEFTGVVGVDFNREVWPHGKTRAARPHGMLFLP